MKSLIKIIKQETRPITQEDGIVFYPVLDRELSMLVADLHIRCLTACAIGLIAGFTLAKLIY